MGVSPSTANVGLLGNAIAFVVTVTVVVELAIVADVVGIDDVVAAVVVFTIVFGGNVLVVKVAILSAFVVIDLDEVDLVTVFTDAIVVATMVGVLKTDVVDVVVETAAGEGLGVSCGNG